MEQAIAKLGKEIYKSIEGGDLLMVLNRLSALVMDTLSCEKVTMFLMDSHEKELWCAISQDLVGVRVRVGQGIAGTVAETGKTVNVKQAYDDHRFSKRFDKATGFRTKSVLAVAVVNRKDEVLAVVQCINKKSQWKVSRSESQREELRKTHIYCIMNMISCPEFASKAINSSQISDMGLDYFNDKDVAIVETFGTELADVLSKHASQLQVMKSIADAHSEDYKRRRASSIVKKSNSGNLKFNRESFVEELSKLSLTTEVQEEFDEEFSDSDFSDIDGKDEPLKEKLDDKKRCGDKDDADKLRRHSMLMRHHNMHKGDGFNKYLISSLNKNHQKSKSIFMPRSSGNSLVNMGSGLFTFDPTTHKLVKDLDQWHCSDIFDANINELMEASVVMFQKMRLGIIYGVSDEVIVNFVTGICHQYRCEPASCKE